MKLFIDSADVKEVSEAIKFNINRVTTNPFFLVNLGTDHISVAKELSNIPEVVEVHVQVPGSSASDFVREAGKLAAISSKIVAKIPASHEGLKAIAEIKKTGFIKTTATAVVTPLQAILAAQAGADYVAVLVGRAYKMGIKGIAVLKAVTKTLRKMGSETKVIAASLHSEEHVISSLAAGADYATISYPLLNKVLSHKAILKTLSEMDEAWRQQAAKAGVKA
ncbi:MAG: hypothetical protein DRJ31_02945 [Candidatus Methanomethylicota archaeon]|uniref:Fructose-6-phosphate aldolase n=1 Tax=Thermoproteota archaeon TaxID=2056631 RepID=A0A497F0W3_9CREN|nr:MAG: hypothetical protein DRJ31_02945 [Candidatus Verstraetearchaeota archaeon]RLE53115.1 MAG: hypothetical protein DRJ33_01945 [Candidatus Verstraetearchaeota archaeon]